MEISGRKALNRQKIISSYNLYIDSRRNKKKNFIDDEWIYNNGKWTLENCKDTANSASGKYMGSGTENWWWNSNSKELPEFNLRNSPTKRLFHERSLSNNFIFRPSWAIKIFFLYSVNFLVELVVEISWCPNFKGLGCLIRMTQIRFILYFFIYDNFKRLSWIITFLIAKGYLNLMTFSIIMSSVYNWKTN